MNRDLARSERCFNLPRSVGCGTRKSVDGRSALGRFRREMKTLSTKRLRPGDRAIAAKLFALMSEVFDEQSPAPLSDAYLDGLMTRPEFWAIAAFVQEEIVGGITAHVLPMTRGETSELFIYDLAVKASHQRQGIGRALVAALRSGGAAAGIDDVFVPADDEDTHALDFYRAIGGAAQPVTVFNFSS